MSLSGFITLDTDTPSKSGLYVTGLPGVTLAQIDGVTKDEQSDMEATFQYLYQLAQTNLKIDLQRALANKFHIDRNIVSRETSKFLADVNSSSSLSGVTIEYLRSKYSRLHISTVEVYLDSPIFHWIASSPPDFVYKEIAFGDGRFITVASNEAGGTGGAAYSDDGASWTSSPISALRNWTAITFVEHLNLFVAVSTSASGSAADQRISTTTDGEAWTAQTTPSDQAYSSIASGNGIIIAIATGTTIIRSEDAETWVSQSITSRTRSKIVFGDGKFVISATNGVEVSNDGISWTFVSFATGLVSSVAYTNGVFIAIQGTHLYRSVDALTWTEVSYPSSVNISGALTFGLDGLFVVAADSSTSIASSDGEHWASVAAGRTWVGMATDGSKIVGVAGTRSSYMEVNGEIDGFGTVFIYRDDEDGQLLGTYEIDTINEGKNQIIIDQDFDADKIFVAINPVSYFRQTENKYFTYDSLSADKLSCTFPCGFGQGSVTQVNDGGLNVTFNVYCSFDKLIEDNLNIFKYALWYRIGVDLVKERIISDRVTRFTVLTPERAKELFDVFNEDYKAALDSAVMNLKLTEDAQCFVCKRPIQAMTSLP